MSLASRDSTVLVNENFGPGELKTAADDRNPRPEGRVFIQYTFD